MAWDGECRHQRGWGWEESGGVYPLSDGSIPLADRHGNSQTNKTLNHDG